MVRAGNCIHCIDRTADSSRGGRMPFDEVQVDLTHSVIAVLQ